MFCPLVTILLGIPLENSYLSQIVAKSNKSYVTLLKNQSLSWFTGGFPLEKTGCVIVQISDVRFLCRENRLIFIWMAAKNYLLPLLKCLHQNIHRLLCADLVKSHFKLPVLRMLESVFNLVWCNLNGSRLFGVIPLTFFFFFFTYMECKINAGNTSACCLWGEFKTNAGA